MKPIFQLKKQTKDLSIIILTALVFALGINLVSTYVVEMVGKGKTSLYIGSICMITAIYVIKKLVSANSDQILRIRGALHFSIENGEFESKEIVGYDFNKDMNEYLNSFINENAAYKKAFLKTASNERVIDEYNFNPSKLDFYNIINSVSELVFLKRLDYHLNSYFVNNEIDRSSLVEVRREQLEPSVLDNKVINLITKDIQEREAFISEDHDDSEEVFFTTGNNGVVYQKLSLELPPESRLTRNKSGFLELENKLFKITFQPNFTGFSTFVPSELIDDQIDDYTCLIDMKLYVSIKSSLIISSNNMEIYQWLDSFLERYEEYASLNFLVKNSNLQLLRLINS